jgi:hypothetical protein
VTTRRLQLTTEEQARVREFVTSLRTEEYREGYGWIYRAVHPMTAQQIDDSYQSWAKGGRGWRAIHEGGTGILAALCWYQHVHKPGSREWRPTIIIRALLAASVAVEPASHMTQAVTSPAESA